MRAKLRTGGGIVATIPVICLLAAFYPGSDLRADDLSFQASVDRTEVPVTEPVTLTMEVSGDKLSGVGAVPAPPLDNLEVVNSSTSSSRNISIVQGRMITTFTRSTVYLLMPIKPGPAGIGQASLDYKGKTYRTDPIDIRILDAGAQPGPPGTERPGGPSPAAEGRPLFLTAAASKDRAYIDQPVIVDFTLYTQTGIEGIEMAAMPEAAGFLSEVLPPPARYETFNQVIDGRRYTGVRIRRMLLYPKVGGEHTVGPMRLRCSVRVRSRDPFSDFFGGSIFGRTAVRTVESEPFRIEALEPPAEGRPPGFKGIVGRYDLSAAASGREVKAGEPVTLTVEITGEGNLKALTEPDIELPDSFRRYDPEIKVESSVRDGALKGSKRFSYLVVPQEEGRYRLGPVSLTFFDTGSGRYRTIETTAGLLEVAPGDGPLAGADPGDLLRTRVRLLKQEIRYIKEPRRHLGTLPPLWWTWPFWIVLLLPLASLFASTAYRRHRTRLVEDVAYARDRRAYGSARRRLKTARRLLRADRIEEFHSAVARVVTEFVGDKFDQPSPGLSRQDIDRLLESRGVPGERRRELGAFLDRIELARFAAVEPTPEETAAVLRGAEKILADLARRL